jgi:hypothetical protein
LKSKAAALNFSPPKLGGQWQEAKMSILFFVCPNTGREISSKVDIDRDSFRTMPPVLSDIKCPDCGTIHNLFNVPTRLSDEPDEEDVRQARSV